MKPKRDRTSGKEVDVDADRFVEELCEYQANLDRCESAERPESITGVVPDRSDAVSSEYRQVLDILHRMRSYAGTQTGQSSSTNPPASANSSQNFGVYSPPKKIGRFRIIKQWGFGGFGVVFQGFDPKLKRDVAIKIPRPEFLNSSQSIFRFAREASIVGQLAHPNIVPIFECSHQGIVPYIVMAFLPGSTLTEWRAAQSDISPRTVAKILLELAKALAHAHERGVLHRDLKSVNVLLVQLEATSENNELEFVPVLTDFGMAYCANGNSPLTRTGTIIGSFCYMSPEQAEGRTNEITAKTDVYGLGAILYELLVGQPPHQGRNDQESLKKALQSLPVPPRTLNPKIPIDLEVICLKCLESVPAQRYSSATALAEDLQRFLNGEPICARPISWVSRVKKWARRHPASTVAIALVTIGLFTMSGLTAWYNAQLITLLRIAETEREIARRSELKATRRAYFSDMRNAKLSLDHSDLQQAITLLDRYKPNQPATESSDFAWLYLWRKCHDTSRVLGSHVGKATSVAVTRNGDLSASGGLDSIIRIRSMPSGRVVTELRGHEHGAVEALNFSPDGLRLASAGADGTVRVWDTVTWEELFVRRDHNSAVSDVVYCSQGRYLASGGCDGKIRLWNPMNGDPAGVLSGHNHKVLCLATHPVKNKLASGGADATIRMWDLDEPGPDTDFKSGFVQLSNLNEWPRGLVFEPNGNSLAVGTTAAATYRFSLNPQNYGDLLGHRDEPANALSLVWPQNGCLVVGLENSQIRMDNRFDPESIDERYYGHSNAVVSIATPTDGSYLISASEDGDVRYWPQFQSQTKFDVEIESNSVSDVDPVCFSTQWCGRSLAVDMKNDKLLIYRMPERELVQTFPKRVDDDFNLSPSGNHLLVRQSDGLTTYYRIDDGRTLWSQQLSRTPRVYGSVCCAFDRSEATSALAVENELQAISLQDAQVLFRLPHPSGVRRSLFIENEGDRQKLATTCDDGMLRVWDVQDRRILEERRMSSGLSFSMSVSQDGKFLAIILGGNQPAVRIWQLDKLTEVACIPISHTLRRLDFEVSKVAFLKGPLLLIQGNAKFALWNAVEGSEVLPFAEFNRAGAFSVSPDRQQIAVPQRGQIQIIDGRPL